MGAQYKPVKGDRVRVLVEGEVEWVSESGSGNFEIGSGHHYIDVKHDKGEVVSIEKIEPGAVLPDGLTISEDGSHLNWLGENYVRQQVEEPVEVFKPGDRVRSLAGGAEYTLADLGYISHGSERTGKRGRWMAYTNSATQESHWTSRDYERVNLS